MRMLRLTIGIVVMFCLFNTLGFAYNNQDYVSHGDNRRTVITPYFPGFQTPQLHERMTPEEIASLVQSFLKGEKLDKEKIAELVAALTKTNPDIDKIISDIFPDLPADDFAKFLSWIATELSPEIAAKIVEGLNSRYAAAVIASEYMKTDIAAKILSFVSSQKVAGIFTAVQLWIKLPDKGGLEDLIKRGPNYIISADKAAQILAQMDANQAAKVLKEIAADKPFRCPEGQFCTAELRPDNPGNPQRAADILGAMKPEQAVRIAKAMLANGQVGVLARIMKLMDPAKVAAIMAIPEGELWIQPLQKGLIWKPKPISGGLTVKECADILRAMGGLKDKKVQAILFNLFKNPSSRDKARRIISELRFGYGWPKPKPISPIPTVKH